MNTIHIKGFCNVYQIMGRKSLGPAWDTKEEAIKARILDDEQLVGLIEVDITEEKILLPATEGRE